MTETYSIADQQLDEAIAHYEQLAEEGRVDCLPETQIRFPACAAALAAHDAYRRELQPYCLPLRRALSPGPPPPQIEGYHDLEEIGRGGMGVVYRARQQGTEREVAIKLIRGERLARVDEDRRRQAMERFRAEARAMRDHPHIVRVYHVGEVDRQPFLVMELLRGWSLREWIRERRLTLADVVDFLRQAAEGLHYAHQHGILHRDLKPANLLIDEERRCLKLADFGLAKFEQGSLEAGDQARPAAVVGTLQYMSPEQRRNSEDVTVASDVYGLGATLFEALTGSPPGPATCPGDAAAESPAGRSLKEINPRIPKAVQRICRKCLADDPAQRFPSAEELAAELGKLQATTQSAVLFVAMGWMLFAFGLLALATSAAVFWLLRIGAPEFWVWLTLFALYPALFVVFGRTRMPELFRSAPARRELWSIWIGNGIAAGVSLLALRAAMSDAAATLAVGYPILAAITSMSSFAMGSNFWRGHYLIGIGWVTAALAMLAAPGVAPLLFGATAACSSWVIGAYELHLARDRSLAHPLVYPPQPAQAWWDDLSLLSRPLSANGSTATMPVESAAADTPPPGKQF